MAFLPGEDPGYFITVVQLRTARQTEDRCGARQSREVLHVDSEVYGTQVLYGQNYEHGLSLRDAASEALSSASGPSS